MTLEPGMRNKDWFVFRQAAQTLKLWILVRWTNPASLNYVGLKGYVPKPIDCKPKTADADAPGKEHKGLVVDPSTVPGAMTESRRQKVLGSWRSFLDSQEASDTNDLNFRNLSAPRIPLTESFSLSEVAEIEQSKGIIDPKFMNQVQQVAAQDANYRCYLVDRNPDSIHYGCLTLNGRYIHGDYDLKDVIDPRASRQNIAIREKMHGQLHMRGPLADKVKTLVNRLIGIEMVQHGGEAQFAAHTEDRVEVFGPRGECGTLTDLKQINDWYRWMWERRTITGSASSPDQKLLPPSRIHHSLAL